MANAFNQLAIASAPASMSPQMMRQWGYFLARNPGEDEEPAPMYAPQSFPDAAPMWPEPSPDGEYPGAPEEFFGPDSLEAQNLVGRNALARKVLR